VTHCSGFSVTDYGFTRPLNPLLVNVIPSMDQLTRACFSEGCDEPR